MTTLEHIRKLRAMTEERGSEAEAASAAAIIAHPSTTDLWIYQIERLISERDCRLYKNQSNV